MSGELLFVASLAARFGPPPAGETWIGDDAAVVDPPSGRLLLAIDPMVEGVHFRFDLMSAADVGFKAVARNVSDIAAMGGRPLHALVSLIVPAGGLDDGVLDGLLDGLVEATSLCPVVGGDTATGPGLVLTVAVTGTVDGPPVLRSGARPGDALFLTGPLGAGAAGLRLGRVPRPVPRVSEGTAARDAGATAMLDISDGLALDLRRLADASGVGVVVDAVPVAEQATWDEAVTGGDDYELVLAAPDPERVVAAFEDAGLERPIEIGRCTADAEERRLGDGPLPEGGWEHRW